MRAARLLLALLLGGFPAGPVAAGDPPAAAKEALVRYFAAVKAGDWAGMYDLMSEGSRGSESREQFVRAREGGLGASLGKAIQARATYEVGAIRVLEDGKRASADVTLRLPDLRSNTSGSMPTPEAVAAAPLHDLQRSMELVVEQGVWKVVRPRAALSPQARERFDKAAKESTERARENQTPAPGTAD
jgi:hypothetical protein